MKKYILPCMYRGIQIHKIAICKTDKKASELLGISIYYLKSYTSKNPTDLMASENVSAYVDSGPIIFEVGRKDLMRKELPLKELQDIIDVYRDKSYDKFKKIIGID